MSEDDSMLNLASGKLGAEVVFATDDFFADKSRLVKDEPPVFIDGKYDENGKWMDGWESRRRRDAGHDWCMVKLACPGIIDAIEMDTRHFTGNYPPAASVEACLCQSGVPEDDTVWHEILSPIQLNGNDRRRVTLSGKRTWSHVRLHIYPDGGMARLRVFGRPTVDWSSVTENQLIDLAASLNGGMALECNDAHFGSMHNLLAPGRGINMGDGWETRRRREPGYDWVIIKLGHAGIIRKIELDTAHFKGNYPDRCFIQGMYSNNLEPSTIAAQSLHWPQLLGAQKLKADTIHCFEQEIEQHEMINLIRLNIVPDGGISRLRLFGNIRRD